VVGKGYTFGQRRTHDDPANAGRGLEVSLAAFSPAGVQIGVNFRHLVASRRQRNGSLMVFAPLRETMNSVA